MSFTVESFVPSGILSFTVNVSTFSFPKLLIVIVYLILSEAVTLPCSIFSVVCLITSADFSNDTTGILVSFVSTPSTFALFTNSFASFPTVTTNLNIDVFLSGTFTFIPASRSSAVYSCFSLFIVILSSTSVVPSGILSFMIISFAKSPSFVAVIV